MIRKNLDEFKDLKREVIINLFERGMDFEQIMKEFKVSRNELVCILYPTFKDKVDFSKYIASTNIEDDKFIVISDTHIGHSKEIFKRLNNVYKLAEYNDIKNIVIAGDLFDGTHKRRKKEYVNKEEQVKQLIKYYPKIDNIKSHILFGDHDLKIIKENKYLDMIKERKDFNILGIFRSAIKWSDNLIYINHKIDDYEIRIPYINSLCSFSGHFHYTNVFRKNNVLVPTLSNITYRGNKSGFILVRNYDGKMIVDNYNIAKNNDIEKDATILVKKLRK